ncbi:ArnT family glycosyltransferase [Bailinhaonella thermotolerans]|nr:glycosyltransferase family 39 protein [Bailinhaonella thermotolerans]
MIAIDDTPVRPREPAWSRWALLAACAAAGLLYLWALDSIGYGNSYYAAAARSMSQDWSAFFFGSFDPLGVSTVDKPPAALWVQALSARVFGFSGAAVIVPQAVLGVLAIAVLHRAVLRWHGPAAASIAAWVMALTPITVAINRDNNPDTLMVLLLVCAAYCVTRAVAAGSGWWLTTGAALVGAGFTAKMLQAWVVAPALFAAYLFAADVRLARGLRHLAGAAAVLLATSFAWVAAVDLLPGRKPYIGGSRDGSAWDLVIGYNGLGRILGNRDGAGTGAGNAGPSFGGEPGLTRLFNDQLAGQISWLLPLCAAALAAAFVVRARARRGGWVLWGGWLVLCWAVFSFAEGIFHPYYTTQLAPAVAALAGAGAVEMWRLYRRPGRLAWALLPAAVAGTVVWAGQVVARTPDWRPWLRPAILTAGALAVLLLVGARLLAHPRAFRAAVAGGVVAGLAVIAAPAVWAASVPAGDGGGMGGVNPTAGPSGFGGPGGGRGGPGRPPGGFPGGRGGGGGFPAAPPGTPPGGGTPDGAVPDGAVPDGGSPGGRTAGGGAGGPGGSRGRGGGMAGFGVASGGLTSAQKAVIEHARKNRGGAEILLATASATGAAPYIIATGEDVVALGGFNGTDQAITVDELARLVADGRLRFVELSGFRGAGGDRDTRLTWVSTRCSAVKDVAGLYDCAPSRADRTTS